MLALALAALVVLPRSMAWAESDATGLFSTGARWSFVGDDLTAQGSYLTWLSAYLLTRFPGREILVTNAGVAGDTPQRALSRWNWDVVPGEPTFIFFAFGAPIHQPSDAGAAVSAGEALGRLVEQGRGLGATPWMLIPPGEGREGAAVVRAVAEAHRVGMVDAAEAIARLSGADAFVPATSPTDASTHLLVAWSLLKAVGAPSEVAALTIDLRSGRFAASQSTVDRVVRTESDLTFSWTADALPMPFNAAVLPALSRAPVIEDLSREILQVVGLSAGQWALHIDGVRIGVYASERLAVGVNLAGEPQSPQYRQARDVLRLLETREKLVADNLRSLAYVEHTLAPDEARPITVERIRALAAERRRDAGTSEDGLAFELFEQRKVRQSASTAAAARLWLQARRAAQPQTHLYQLKRLR